MPLDPHAVTPPAPIAAHSADEERFRLVAEALQGFVYDADLRTGTVTRTEGMARILGWVPAEVPETTEWWRAQIHPDDLAALGTMFQAKLADPAMGTIDAEYRVRHRDGHWVWVLDRSRIVRDADGRPVRYVGLTTDVTARRQAEEARDEVETRLRLLIEQSPSSIHVIDMAGRTVLVNPAFERMWGIGMAAFEGYILWDDPQLEPLMPYVRRALAGEVVRIPPYHHDARISVGQGTERMIETTVYPVRDEAGTVRELVVIHADVTDRELAARTIRETERRLAEVLEVSPLPLVQLDADGRILFANEASARALGVPRDALLGRAYDEEAWGLATPDGTPLRGDEAPVVRALAGEAVRDVEVRIERQSDGARRIVEMHAAPLRDRLDRVSGVIVAFDDVTERHAAAAERERLLAAEQRARGEADRKRQHADFLAEASRTLSASLDFEATLATLARSAVPQLGDWCAVDMLETPRAPVAPGEPVPDWPPVVRRLAVAHEDPAKVAWAWELEQRAPQDWSAPGGLPRVLKEGVSEFYPAIDDAFLVASAKDEAELALLREINFSAYICVPLVARGRVLGALTLCHTDSRRHYDADDLALAEDLARRAAVAVDNASLYGDAVHANRAKADFLAVMSHELRTPLNAILGYAGLLDAEVAGPLAEGQRDFVQRGRDAAQRLLALVDDLLTFAKLEAGRVTVNVQPVPVRALVEQVVPLVAPQAAARGVTVTAEADDIPPSLCAAADHERAVQVLLNLLANAVKFSPGGGRVTVRVACPDEATVHVAVQDTGVGIAGADLERIFDPFVQLEEGRTRTRGGAGLGLAISRDLARAMDGDVLAVSRPGAGSTFTLALPRAGATSA